VAGQKCRGRMRTRLKLGQTGHPSQNPRPLVRHRSSQGERAPLALARPSPACSPLRRARYRSRAAQHPARLRASARLTRNRNTTCLLARQPLARQITRRPASPSAACHQTCPSADMLVGTPMWGSREPGTPDAAAAGTLGSDSYVLFDPE
jgi:hypothetical protein